MNRFLASTTLVLLLACTTYAREQSRVLRAKPPAPRAQPLASREQSMLARVTVYWARGGAGSDRYTRLHKASTGMRLQSGHCAVDPRRIPYGSRIVFPDRTTLLAVDTGTAVKNRKAARLGGRNVYERSAIVVDRFFETKGQALAWARRNPAFMAVRVIPPTYRPQVATVTRVVPPVVQAPRLTSSPRIASSSKQNAPFRSISAMKMQ